MGSPEYRPAYARAATRGCAAGLCYGRTLMAVRRALGALPLLAVVACGGSPAGPAPIPSPNLHTVTLVAFYDQDADGVADPGEPGRVPGVVVGVGGRSARSEPGTGRLVIAGVPEGVHLAVILPETLPAFYTVLPGTVLNVRSPATEDVWVPLTLAIGANRPHTYMAFGDSITVGEGSTDRTGYRGPLEERLEAHFGAATVVNQGISGTRSNRGAERIRDSLNRTRPAYTLVMYGTNDWNDDTCRSSAPACFTVASLRRILETAKARSSLPVLATIPPVNVGYDARAPASRQVWVQEMNGFLRTLAREEGAVLADVYEALAREPNLSSLFVDHVHPNDRGYEIIADEFFRALSQPLATSGGETLALFSAPHPRFAGGR